MFPIGNFEVQFRPLRRQISAGGIASEGIACAPRTEAPVERLGANRAIGASSQNHPMTSVAVPQERSLLTRRGADPELR